MKPKKESAKLQVQSNILHVWFGVCFEGDQLRITAEMTTGKQYYSEKTVVYT